MPRSFTRLVWSLLAVVVAGLAVFGPARAEDKRPVVYVAPIEGIIDLGLAPFVRRVLNEAADAGAAAVILEINTFGGRVDAAVQIRDALLNAQQLEAVQRARQGEVGQAHGRQPRHHRRQTRSVVGQASGKGRHHQGSGRAAGQGLRADSQGLSAIELAAPRGRATRPQSFRCGPGRIFSDLQPTVLIESTDANRALGTIGS